jgi:hypothetical protein
VYVGFTQLKQLIINLLPMKNTVQLVVSTETENAANQKIAEINGLFPDLLSLTPDEKAGGMKLGEKSLSFASKGVEFMQTNPQFTPVFVDVPEAIRDLEASSKLFSIARQLQVLVDKLNDTATQAGMEAMSAVMAYYNSVKQASKQGVPGAKTLYDEMSTRFPGKARVPKSQSPE